MEFVYKCVNCGSVKKRVGEESLKTYLVMDTDEAYEITCSRKCAEELKNKKIEKCIELMNKIEKQNIETEEL